MQLRQLAFPFHLFAVVHNQSIHTSPASLWLFGCECVCTRSQNAFAFWICMALSLLLKFVSTYFLPDNNHSSSKKEIVWLCHFSLVDLVPAPLPNVDDIGWRCQRCGGDAFYPSSFSSFAIYILFKCELNAKPREEKKKGVKKLIFLL